MTSAYKEKEYVIPVDTDEEFRCSKCNKLFLKGSLTSGSSFEVKCPRCSKKGDEHKERFMKV